MIIKTRNGTKGRSLVRANRQLSDLSWAFSRLGDRPVLQVNIEGSDGKYYSVLLDRDDLRSIDAGRKQFPEVER